MKMLFEDLKVILSGSKLKIFMHIFTAKKYNLTRVQRFSAYLSTILTLHKIKYKLGHIKDLISIYLKYLIMFLKAIIGR